MHLGIEAWLLYRYCSQKEELRIGISSSIMMSYISVSFFVQQGQVHSFGYHLFYPLNMGACSPIFVLLRNLLVFSFSYSVNGMIKAVKGYLYGNNL